MPPLLKSIYIDFLIDGAKLEWRGDRMGVAYPDGEFYHIDRESFFSAESNVFLSKWGIVWIAYTKPYIMTS
jgi:hypothetical protein